jgi:spore germination protein YaaH
VMMIYDNQYDAGPGASIAPSNWSQNCLAWLKRTAGTKGVAGIAAYGYKGDEQSGKIAINTSATIKRQTATHRPTRTKDGDLVVKDGSIFYNYADQQTMQTRLKQVQQSGLTRLSVWSLGDNPWF